MIRKRVVENLQLKSDLGADRAVNLNSNPSIDRIINLNSDPGLPRQNHQPQRPPTPRQDRQPQQEHWPPQDRQAQQQPPSSSDIHTVVRRAFLDVPSHLLLPYQPQQQPLSLNDVRPLVRRKFLDLPSHRLLPQYTTQKPMTRAILNEFFQAIHRGFKGFPYTVTDDAAIAMHGLPYLIADQGALTHGVNRLVLRIDVFVRCEDSEAVVRQALQRNFGIVVLDSRRLAFAASDRNYYYLKIHADKACRPIFRGDADTTEAEPPRVRVVNMVFLLHWKAYAYTNRTTQHEKAEDAEDIKFILTCLIGKHHSRVTTLIKRRASMPWDCYVVKLQVPSPDQ
ncbi:hypothetical protein GJ744_010414 [Endocarpon pusillum]|uniref:Uncharacterized protein n=1 Tax=Endocarpon pusillum TaxID=364733 RepID=A0A8H7AE78_9EURO|nr:hypothetical protein GJ744_010414 [Endocarpon pusillum]